MFFTIRKKTEFAAENIDDYKNKISRYAPHKAAAAEVLRLLSCIPPDDEMTKRDAFDIARTVLCRYINAAIFKAQELYASNAPLEELEMVTSTCEGLMCCMIEILSLHSDYSLLSSLSHLQSVTETNPNFEITLKNNAECAYCRSFIFENAKYLYLPEMRALFSLVKKCLAEGSKYDPESLNDSFEQIRSNYFETPLANMERSCGSFNESLSKAANLIDLLVL
jgi:hypothetical protein